MATTDAASDYLELQLLNHEFGTTTYAKPANQYIALFTVDPTDAGGGTEVSGGAYARYNLAPNSVTAGNWTIATDGSGVASNAVVVTFPTSTAAWGTIVGYATYDAATGGNLKVYCALDSSQVISTNNTFSFPIGGIKITVG